MVSKILTGVVDIDLQILNHLTDDVILEELLLTHKYVYNISLNPKLWHDRIIKWYHDFPPQKGIKDFEWKKLYYKLKYQDWTALIVWAEVNNYTTLVDWIIKQETYKTFVQSNMDKLIKQFWRVPYNVVESTLIKRYNFICSHKSYFLMGTLSEKSIRKSLISGSKSTDSDVYKMFYRQLFECDIS